jgi:hypothetical protein
MVRRLLSILLASVLFIPVVASAQDVEVSVDRAEMARGETLTLTIRVYQQQQNIQLDLSPITESFDILSTRTSSQIRSINNRVESWVDYIVTLFPTREGALEIPALSIAGQTSDPIAINVVDAGPNSNQPDNDLFLETEVNKESVYVQEQLLFTIRLYYTISGIRNPQFTELEMPDTVIQLIGSPNQYDKLIDGVRYGVYEKRYVIFPQRSGPLEIPDILFRGEVTDGSSNFVFRNLNTQRVTAYIEGSVIDIKERPPEARNLEYWLPAGNLSVTETWDNDLNNLRVGDTLTRTIELVADGLDGAVLPPFSPVEVDGVNSYADPSDIQRTFVEGQIVGTRIEKTGIVPTASGFVTIPQVSIPWWDINSDELKYALVPETQLTIATVAGELPAEQLIADTGEELDLTAPTAPVLDQTMLDAAEEARLINIPVIWLNIIIGSALLIVLGSIYFLVIRGFNVDPLAMVRAYFQAQAAKRYPQNHEGVAFSQLSNAIRKGEPEEIRAALITWAAHHYAPSRVISMDDIIRHSAGTELHTFCLNVQASLYNSDKHTVINTDSILNELSSMRKQQLLSNKQSRRTEPYVLPPLYKT